MRHPSPALSLALLVLAASPAPATAQRRGGPTPPGVAAHRDLAYVPGGHERQTLDLFLPDRPAGGEGAEPLPVVIWVHGGGWRAGSKANCPPLRAGFVQSGYAVASVGYRLTDAAPFPAQIQDCRAAVRWLRAHADEYGLDPNRIGAWGGSAGGHLVALLGTAGDATAWDVGEHKDQSARVQAVCPYYPPTDLPALFGGGRPRTAEIALLGGSLEEKRELAERASPLTHVTKDDPPFFLLHGEKDRLVPPDQSRTLHAALQRAGVASELKVFPDAAHATAEFHTAETHGAVRAFFDRHLREKPADPPR